MTRRVPPAIPAARPPNEDAAHHAVVLEAGQLNDGKQVLGHARHLLKLDVSAAELRFAAVRLAESLEDALKVAEERGARLRDGGAL